MEASTPLCFDNPSGSLGMLDQDGTFSASKTEFPDTEISTYPSKCGSIGSFSDCPRTGGLGVEEDLSMDYVTGVRVCPASAGIVNNMFVFPLRTHLELRLQAVY
jgi:hypothetical protein